MTSSGPSPDVAASDGGLRRAWQNTLSGASASQKRSQPNTR